MEKYIFLDFDGVLNTPKGKFDQKTIDNLRYLLERSDAKVIISSTWRLQGMEYMQQLWNELHLPGEVAGLTPSCNSITFSSVDGAEQWQGLHAEKGLEIAEWLRLNANEPYRYVILDDEDNILFTQKEHFVKVKGSKGFSKSEAMASLRILNAKAMSRIKRWLYHILELLFLYVIVQTFFTAYIYWLPDLGLCRMEYRPAQLHECLIYHHHFSWQK